MKKATQKFLCILLAAVMLSSLTGISAFAENQNVNVVAEDKFEKTGTEIERQAKTLDNKLSANTLSTEELSVVEIDTAEELITYRDNINSGIVSNAILLADVDLNGYVWAPIGSTADAPFSANFDGNGYKILNVTISTIDTAVQGLFGYVSVDGVVRNLTITGNIQAPNAGGIAGQLDGVVTNCTNEANVDATVFAGGIAAMDNGTITGCTNNGVISVTGSVTGAAGGIAATGVSAIADCENNGYINIETGAAGGIVGYITENSLVTDCVNTASVHGNVGAGGIVGSTKGPVSNCKNTGEIYASDSLAGGIVGKAENTIEDSINTGVLTGKTYIGGIAGRTSGSLKNVKNYGEVYATASYAGGITGYVSGGSVGNHLIFDKCVNYGSLYVNEYAGGIVGGAVAYIKVENSYNIGLIMAKGEIIGGIVGRLSDWSYSGEHLINKTANLGNVESAGNNVGGICGYMIRGTINNSYNTGIIKSGSYNYGGIVANAGSKTNVNNSFNYSSTTKLASSSTCSNVYTLSSQNSGQNKTSESFKDGSMLALLNDNTVWKQGDKYPVFVDDISETGVKTQAQLLETLADESISEIILADDISISAPIEITRNVIINGNYHNVVSKDNVFAVSNSNVEIKNISLRGNKTLIQAQNSAIKFSGVITLYNYIFTAIDAENSTLTFDERVAFTAMPDETTISSDMEQSINLAHNVSKQDDNYLYTIGNSQIKYDKTDKIIIKANQNEGISYDIYGVNKTFDIYLMVPSCASTDLLVYTVVDANGVEIESFANNFNETASVSVRKGYIDCSVSVMQSALPTLYIDIDETYGTIDAMHSDPEHETKAYGQMQIDVPDALVEKYGWDKTYKSKEGDSNKPGTMEIKGRGNSTWNTTPGVKKPYQVKSEKKVDFLGMGKAKTWCLLKSGEKQKFGLDLGLAIGLDCTPDSRFVDVFMNGEYYGYYAMTEKVEIKEERVEITDLEDEVDENGITAETDLTGGYLLEIDNYSEEPRISTNGNYLTIKSPENLDKKATKNNNYSYIYNHIDDIFNAIYGDGKMKDGSSYMEHIDVESFVRYYWHQEFIANFDCGVGSTYMYKDSDNVDHKLYAGPIWDSDNLLKTTEGWYVKNRLRNEGADTIYKQLMERKDFVSYAIWYYENGIRDILSKATDIATEYQGYLPTAKNMDYIKWGVKEYGGGSEMVTKLNTRFAWIDAHYTELMNEATIGSAIDVENVLNTATPYTINNVKVTDATGIELGAVPTDSDFIVDVNLTASVDRETVDKVIVVCYDSLGRMIATNSEDVNIPSKTALSTKVNILATKQQVKRIKAFVWKDLTSAIPLSDLEEIIY